MESSIFVSAPFKGVFWHFKVDRRILLTLTVELTGQNKILCPIWPTLMHVRGCNSRKPVSPSFQAFYGLSSRY